jgi:hypothetical protein
MDWAAHLVRGVILVVQRLLGAAQAEHLVVELAQGVGRDAREVHVAVVPELGDGAVAEFHERGGRGKFPA